MSPSPLLKAESLVRRYDGLTVLDGISIEIAEGECIGLVGENGCGKTSLLNVLSGVDRADQGRIFLFTDTGLFQDVTCWSAWQRARAGLLHYFQSPHVWRNLTVREHVLAAATSHTLDGSIFGTIRWSLSSGLRKRTRERCEELLDFVGLRDRAEDRAGELSFGQMKLVSMARMLASPARRMLLLDEPTAGIATKLVDRMIEMLRKVRSSGIGMLVVEHDREMIEALADQVVELRNGKLASDMEGC